MASTHTEQQKVSTIKQRYYFLDGLRGWASLAVLFYHVFVQICPITPESIKFLPLIPLFNGQFAINLFFVISGFALSIGYAERHHLKSLIRMAAGRYLRLAIPILAACSFVHFAMISGVIPPAELRPAHFNKFLLFESSISNLFLFSLFDVFFRFRMDISYILPLWTMPVELMGSLIVIALQIILGIDKRYLWIGGTILFAVLLVTNSYFSLFLAGMLMANMFISYNFQKTCYQAMFWGCFFIGWATPFVTNNHSYPWNALSPIFMLVIILFFSSILWVVSIRQFFETKISSFLGHISFPLYLIHGPILWTFTLSTQNLLTSWGLTNTTVNLIVGFSTVFISIGAAIVFSPINDFAIFISRKFGEWVTNTGERCFCFLKIKFISSR